MSCQRSPSSQFFLFSSLSSISPIVPFPPIPVTSLLFLFTNSPPPLLFPLLISIIISYKVVDLIPGGRNIAVTDETKAEYIRLVAHHRMTAAIRSQVSTSMYSCLHSHLTPYGALPVDACLAWILTSTFLLSFPIFAFLFVPPSLRSFLILMSSLFLSPFTLSHLFSSSSSSSSPSHLPSSSLYPHFILLSPSHLPPSLS